MYKKHYSEGMIPIFCSYIIYDFLHLKNFLMFNIIYIAFQARISIKKILIESLWKNRYRHYRRYRYAILWKAFLATKIRYKSIGNASIPDTCI